MRSMLKLDADPGISQNFRTQRLAILSIL
jgi:hypothetical protein